MARVSSKKKAGRKRPDCAATRHVDRHPRHHRRGPGHPAPRTRPPRRLRPTTAARSIADLVPAHRSRIVSHTGGATDYYDLFVERYKSAATPPQEQRYLFNLGAFRDRSLLQRTLDMAMTSDVRTPERPLLDRLAAPPTWRAATSAGSSSRAPWDELSGAYGQHPRPHAGPASPRSRHPSFPARSRSSSSPITSSRDRRRSISIWSASRSTSPSASASRRNWRATSRLDFPPASRSAPPLPRAGEGAGGQGRPTGVQGPVWLHEQGQAPAADRSRLPPRRRRGPGRHGRAPGRTPRPPGDRTGCRRTAPVRRGRPTGLNGSL